MRRPIRIPIAHAVREMAGERDQRADWTGNDEFRERAEAIVRRRFAVFARLQHDGVRRAGVDEFHRRPRGGHYRMRVLQRVIFRQIRQSDLFQRSARRIRLSVDAIGKRDFIVRPLSRHRKRGLPAKRLVHIRI